MTSLWALIVVGVLTISAPLTVRAADTSVPSLNSTLSQLEQSQGVTSVSQLTCSKVTSDQFEALGDAVMETLHPGSAHTYMEQMMGGEGSATLKVMHIAMGQQYLGCGSSYYGMIPFGTGMMGGGYGMMAYGSTTSAGWTMGKNGNYYPPQSMMGWPGVWGGYSSGSTWFGLVTMVLIWVLLALGIAGAIKWLRKK